MYLKKTKNSLILKTLGLFLVLSIFSCSNNKKDQNTITIYFDNNEPAIQFAAKNLEKTLVSKAFVVNLKPLNVFSSASNTTQIIIAKNTKNISENLKKYGGLKTNNLEQQDYALRITKKNKNKTFWAIGGDRVGAMYGGIHISEIIKAFGLDSLKNKDHKPYIKKRGLKFNIPLDQTQPSHDDRGTAAQTNIKNMWDYRFWTEYLDVLAKQRYNVLSLWNQHPFPSMIKLDDYPEVALNNVYNAKGKVKTITIDEKIALWKKIMDYAHDRGIEVYIITWNIHMNGALNKYGITENKTNKITKDYLRKSVEKIFLTYPKLAGIGVTAGENMGGMNSDEKEQWMWETYGKGIQDIQKIQPKRNITFIHRYWWTDFDKIDSRFGQLKDGYDMSFKYARARIYSDYAPPFAKKELLPNLPKGKATWWNIRNDDIYNLRWGDPDYVKQFILNLPKGNKTAGYYMGSDRYAWGRESISLNPTTPRTLENEKHWYSFLLWGRLGYDPNTSTSLLKGLLKNRFGNVSSENLYSGWQEASKIIPLVNKFHWYSWDYLWWPEACTSTGVYTAIDGYHDINDFINAPVMDDSNIFTINEYVARILKNEDLGAKTTPLDVANKLAIYAKVALKKVVNINASGNIELSETLGDIRAMAQLGNYYSYKISGATNFKLFLETKEEKYKVKAIIELEKSLQSWLNYSNILNNQYSKMTIAMHGYFDWDKLSKDVKADIQIVKNTK